MIPKSKSITRLKLFFIKIKALVIIVSLFFICFISKGQNQQLADSLIHVYKNISLKDSSYLEIVRSIAANHTIPEEKLYYANILIKVAIKQNKHKWLYRGYLQRGNAYRLKGDLDQAVSSYFQCIKAASSASYNAGKGAGYIALGDVYSRLYSMI